MPDDNGLADVAELYDHAACGLLVTDADGTIRVVNATFCKWTGHAREELIGGLKLQDLLTPGGRVFHQTHWAPLLQTRGSVAAVELDLIDASGEVTPMILHAVRRVAGDIVRDEIAAFGAEELHASSLEQQRALASAQAELDVQKRSAEDRALLAEQMIDMVSHDLRNPLSTIQLGATVLKDHELSAKGRQRVEAILRATKQSTRLIGDLVVFTQARLGGGLRLQPREIDPHAVVARAIDDLRVSFPGRRLEHATVGAGTCIADPDRLAQLLGNLAGNAMTLGDPTGVVTLTSTIDDRSLTLSVHSDGPPVPPEQLPTLFDAMARGSGDGPSPAAGLGFFIVREIARAHGGSVTAQSSPDDGTTIGVVLPVAAKAG